MSKNRERLWIPEISLDPLINESLNLVVSAGNFVGLVEIELIEAATGRVKEYHKFPNIFLTAGMDGLFVDSVEIANSTFDSMMDNLFVGTGSTVPDPSDISLEAPIDNTTSNGGFGNVSGYVTGSGGGPDNLGNPYHFIRKTRVFIESEAIDPALSELGWKATATTPDFQFTRALFKDNGGSPITINKTSEDQLRVTYEIRLYPPTAQFSGSFVMGDSEISHSWTASATDIDQTNTWGYDSDGIFRNFGKWRPFTLGDEITAYPTATIPANPTGTVSQWGWFGPDQQSTNFSRSLFTYQSGSLEQARESTFDTARLNFDGGIEGMAIAWPVSAPQFAFKFNPAIQKTDLQKLTMVFTLSATASVTASA